MRLLSGLSIRIATWLACLGVVLSALSGSVMASPKVHVIDEEPPDCRQIPPEEVPPLALDTSERLPLEVRVMVERADLTTAKQHVRTTKDIFDRIGIDLRATFDLVEPADLTETSAQAEYFEFMKNYYGGRRPKGVDVVYFMTRYWSGGFADCIGGVRFPDRAFAFGSIDYAIEGLVPAPTADEGVIAAHEIGHLLGAHHHYSNCGEAVTGAVTRYEVGACTVMSPLALTASRVFGTLETSFVRHYTAKFARG